MSDRRSQISELLAARDGEPADLSRLAGMSAQEQAAVLQQLGQVKQSLNALPDVTVDEEVWRRLLDRPRPSPWLRFPLATAASVFFATAVGIYLVAGQFGGTHGQPPGFVEAAPSSGVVNLDRAGLQLAGYLSQSKDLERRLYRSADRPGRIDPVEGSLLLRLADVDAQIASLYEVGEVDANRRLALWQQRVNLLQSLVAVRSGEVEKLADTRSM